MATVTTPLDELLDPVAQCLTPEIARRLVALRAPSSVQAHMQELAAKNTEGQLSERERAEYESLVAAGTFIAILQSKARQLLANNVDAA